MATINKNFTEINLSNQKPPVIRLELPVQIELENDKLLVKVGDVKNKSIYTADEIFLIDEHTKTWNLLDYWNENKDFSELSKKITGIGFIFSEKKLLPVFSAMPVFSFKKAESPSSSIIKNSSFRKLRKKE